MGSIKFRLAQLYDECECEKKKKHELHYISFDDTFHRLREVTDDVLQYFDDKGDLVKFVVGQLSVHTRDNKFFDFCDRETWDKKEMKDRKKFLEDKGFNEMVVIGCVEEDLIRQDVIEGMRDSELYSIALAQRLIMHYTYNKADERLYNDSLQLGRTSLEKTSGNLIYIALKFQPYRKEKSRSRSRRKWVFRSSSRSSSSSSSSSDSSNDSSTDDDIDSSVESKRRSRSKTKKSKKEKKKKKSGDFDDFLSDCSTNEKAKKKSKKKQKEKTVSVDDSNLSDGAEDSEKESKIKTKKEKKDKKKKSKET